MVLVLAHGEESVRQLAGLDRKDARGVQGTLGRDALFIRG